MIYDIVISDQAEIDLRGIFEYIAFELQAPENASGQLDRLEACIMDLDHMPKRYRQYELEPWKSRGLRVAPVDNYLVLYIFRMTIHKWLRLSVLCMVDEM